MFQSTPGPGWVGSRSRCELTVLCCGAARCHNEVSPWEVLIELDGRIKISRIHHHHHHHHSYCQTPPVQHMFSLILSDRATSSNSSLDLLAVLGWAGLASSDFMTTSVICGVSQLWGQSRTKMQCICLVQFINIQAVFYLQVLWAPRSSHGLCWGRFRSKFTISRLCDWEQGSSEAWHHHHPPPVIPHPPLGPAI